MEENLNIPCITLAHISKLIFYTYICYPYSIVSADDSVINSHPVLFRNCHYYRNEIRLDTIKFCSRVRSYYIKYVATLDPIRNFSSKILNGLKYKFQILICS